MKNSDDPKLPDLNSSMTQIEWHQILKKKLLLKKTSQLLIIDLWMSGVAEREHEQNPFLGLGVPKGSFLTTLDN